MKREDKLGFFFIGIFVGAVLMGAIVLLLN
jgi:hypothetical protein